MTWSHPASPPFSSANNTGWGGTSSIESQVRAAVDACLATGCRDVGVGIIPGRVSETTPAPSTTVAPQDDILTLPIIGEVDLQKQSLVVSTLLIALVDGVNPCSVWVLSMLLAITLHTGSRKKVLIIGLVFLTVTAAVYALFIAGLFTVFSLSRQLLSWISGRRCPGRPLFCPGQYQGLFLVPGRPLFHHR